MYDYYRGNAVRVKYQIVPCSGSFKVCSASQVITDSLPASVVYSSLRKIESSVVAVESPFSSIRVLATFQNLESVAKGQILVTGSDYYRVMSDSYIDGAGFKVAEAILLNSPVGVVHFYSSSGYDVTTDAIVANLVSDIVTGKQIGRAHV